MSRAGAGAKKGALCLEAWQGRTETPVEIIGTTSTRYRIRAITRTRLAGRYRWLKPGAVALVPKDAVRIEP
jgi:hypothetical protein